MNSKLKNKITKEVNIYNEMLELLDIIERIDFHLDNNYGKTFRYDAGPVFILDVAPNHEGYENLVRIELLNKSDNESQYIFIVELSQEFLYKLVSRPQLGFKIVFSLLKDIERDFRYFNYNKMEVLN